MYGSYVHDRRCPLFRSHFTFRRGAVGRFSSDDEYVNTPQGLFTASGLWFHTTQPLLEEYAGAVFEYVPIERLIYQAARWVRLPETTALWSLPVWLWLVGPWTAALVTVGLYLGMRIIGPGLAHPAASPLLTALDHPVVQAAYYAAMLSYFAVGGALVPVGVGLIAFIAFRWGLVRRVTSPLVQPMLGRFYAPSVPDHVLHALIHHVALRHDVSLPQIDRLKRAVYARRFS